MNDNQSNSPFGTELEPVPEEKQANYSHQKSGSNNYWCRCRVGSEHRAHPPGGCHLSPRLSLCLDRQDTSTPTPASLPQPRLPSLPCPLPWLLRLGDLGQAATRFLQLGQGVGGRQGGHGGVLHEGVGGLCPAGVAACPPGVVAAGGPLGAVRAVGLLCALCAWGREEVGLEKLENMTLIAAPILLAPSQKSVIT